MRGLVKWVGAAGLLMALGSVQADTVLCPDSLGPVGGGITATRQVEVTGALLGGECYYKLGNFQGDDFSSFLGNDYTLIEKDVAPDGGAGGILRYTGSIAGTWAMSPSQWPAYDEIFLAFHFGNGSGDPDSFIVELKRDEISGNWALIPSSVANGLSNIYLLGRGEGPGDDDGDDDEVPEPATLALLGVALAGMGITRRRGRKL